MIDVISIKFKNRGKSYYFDPNGFEVKTGDKVIVETSKGLEIADCFRSVHAVEETAVVQPLRPVIRVATSEDLRVEEINKRCEKDAFGICEKKIQEHGLDMKLVDVECSFDGTKTTFFFTSDGRVDFRELVKDLAGIFRNRIELRQIGVRDEAKMIGGLGICGRPYCCHQFLDDFQPVSTKMAKVQSLSLNPTKISGSCGRLMCCLRYEQEAYEDLLKKVPKQGAYVETKDGYGTAVQVNLLRQTIKVKLDKDNDDSIRVYNANEYAAVPGGRPKEGEEPPKVYEPVEEEEEAIEVPHWVLPEEPTSRTEPAAAEEAAQPDQTAEPRKERRERKERPPRPNKGEKPAKFERAPKHEKNENPEAADKAENGEKQPEVAKVKVEAKKGERPARGDRPPKPARAPKAEKTPRPEKPEAAEAGEAEASIGGEEKTAYRNNRNRRRKPHHKPEGSHEGQAESTAKPKEKPAEGKKAEGHAKPKPAPAAEGEKQEGQPHHKPNRRRYYHHGKPGGGHKE